MVSVLVFGTMDSVACVSDKLACSVQIPAKVVVERSHFRSGGSRGVPGFRGSVEPPKIL